MGYLYIWLVLQSDDKENIGRLFACRTFGNRPSEKNRLERDLLQLKTQGKISEVKRIPRYLGTAISIPEEYELANPDQFVNDGDTFMLKVEELE